MAREFAGLISVYFGDVTAAMTVDETAIDDTIMEYKDDDGAIVDMQPIVNEHDEETVAEESTTVADQLYLNARARFNAHMLQPIDDDLLDASKSTMGDAFDESGTPNAFVKPPSEKWYQSGDPAEMFHAPDQTLLSFYDILTHGRANAKMERLEINPGTVAQSLAAAQKGNFEYDRKLPTAGLPCTGSLPRAPEIKEPLGHSA